MDNIQSAADSAEEGHHHVPTSASDTILQTAPPSRPAVRQNTTPAPAPILTKTRNLRNLTLPPPVSPSTSSSSAITVQPNHYQSLAEGAANLAAQGPLTGALAASRPGTPSMGPSVPPRTPLMGHTPLSAPSPLPITSPSGKPSTKGKLKSLLPRSHNEAHSYFLAKIEIEQLANVPLVRGEFGIRWKLKSSVSAGEIRGERPTPSTEEGGGLLGKMKARSHGKGRGKEDLQGAGEFGMYQPHVNASSPSLISEGSRNTTTTINSFSSYSSGESGPSRTSSSATTSTSDSSISAATNSTDRTKVAPNGNFSRNFFSPRAGEASPPGFGVNQYLFSNSKAYEDSLLFSPNQQAFSSNAADPLSPGYDGVMSPSLVSPTGTITQANASNHPSGFGALSPRLPQLGTLSSSLSPSKGLIPYRPLKDHSITYSFPLNAIVKFDIARGGSSGHDGKPRPNLQPNEFKLVIIQRVIPDDPDGPPQNPRLGAVYLNLAEYVGKGKVERRYLLKESRVNATLKLSVELTYVSGNNEYVAPPLPKAEIMGGIENFLVQNENLYKQRTKDIYGYTYGPYRDKEELEVDLLGQTSGDILDDSTPNDQGSIKAVTAHDPYALPSESESELEDHGTAAHTEIEQGRRTLLRSLTRGLTMPSEKPQPRATLDAKEAERLRRRQLRREERQRRYRLELEKNPYALPPASGESGTESEQSDADGFESAPEDNGGKVDTDSMLQNEESHSSTGHNSRNDHGHNRPRAPYHDLSLGSFASFDIQRLPLAYGPKTTEVLIDALFNPSLTTDKSKENPFTIYISPSDLERMNEEEQQALLEQYGTRLGALHMGPSQVRAPTIHNTGRSYSQTTTSSTTTASDSGSSPIADEIFLERIRSPGQDTIVPSRGQRPAGLGIGGVALDRNRDTTVGRSAERPGGVGALLQSYYKNRKEKKEGRKKGEPRRGETTVSTTTSEHSSQHPLPSPPSMNVLGSPVFVQEPAGMLGEDKPDARRHRRTGTGGTMESTLSSLQTNNSSSTSLSSISLGSRSGHGHIVPPVPPLIPGNVSAAAAIASPNKHPLPIPRPLTRQSTTASNDLSVPDGRMDKTGFVKGAHPGTSPVTAHGFGSSINRWWKGLGGHSAATVPGSTHKASVAGLS